MDIYIYLHLVDFYGKFREIYHTWIPWVSPMIWIDPKNVYRSQAQFGPFLDVSP